MDAENLLNLTVDIVSAHISNNTVEANEVPLLLKQVHATLSSLGSKAEEAPSIRKPVVSPRMSVKPDHLTCMICGRNQSMLKRHLLVAHELTPEMYRANFRLPADYPMVSPRYAERRRELATKLGFGRSRRDGASAAAGT